MNYDIGVFTRRRIISPAESYYAVPPAAVAGYTAQGVNFNGTNVWLNRGAGLSGAADGKVVTASFWMKQNGNNAGFNSIFQDDSSKASRWYRYNDDKFRFNFYNSATSIIATVGSVSTYTSGGGWKHVLLSVDLATTTAQLYINDVSDVDPITVTNDTINWTGNTDYGIGARADGSLLANADFADIYINTSVALDLSNSANRRKFISALGAPVDLGSDGSTPTGTAPIIYLHGAVASWETNDGTGGGFTENGTLTAAGSNPP